MSSFSGFVRKEVYHILRDRKTLVVVLLMPLIQVLLFGGAVTTDVDSIRLVLIAPDRDHRAAELLGRFAASPLYEPLEVRPSRADLEELFRTGEAHQAVVLPPSFAERARRPGGAELLVVTDATDPNTAAARETYTQAVLRAYMADLSGASAPPLVQPITRFRFNPALDSTQLFVPGLIAFVLTIVSALMTSISITREKETGTMEVLLVSPLRPWQIVLGKVAPYLVLGAAEVALVLLAAVAVFQVPVRGSPVLLVAESLLFIVTSLALGVLISTRTNSQRVAMLMSLAGLMLPTLILSGFIFPIDSMPRALQWLSHAVPARWFLEIARGIMIRGVGLDLLWPQTVILAGMTVLLLAAGAARLQTRLA